MRGWYASGTTEYSEFTLAPVDQDFENMTLAVTAEFAPTEAWSSRLMVGHAEDNLEQNQSDDFIDTERNTVDWQNDIELSGSTTLTAGLLWQDEEADAFSDFGFAVDAYASDVTTSQVYLQAQGDYGPHRVLLGGAYTDHETFGGHATGNVEYGFAFAGGATYHVLRRHRLPRAGCDRSLQHLRRQPGSRAGGVDELRDRLSPADRRTAIGLDQRRFATTSTT